MHVSYDATFNQLPDSARFVASTLMKVLKFALKQRNLVKRTSLTSTQLLKMVIAYLLRFPALVNSRLSSSSSSREVVRDWLSAPHGAKHTAAHLGWLLAGWLYFYAFEFDADAFFFGQDVQFDVHGGRGAHGPEMRTRHIEGAEEVQICWTELDKRFFKPVLSRMQASARADCRLHRPTARFSLIVHSDILQGIGNSSSSTNYNNNYGGGEGGRGNERNDRNERDRHGGSRSDRHDSRGFCRGSGGSGTGSGIASNDHHYDQQGKTEDLHREYFSGEVLKAFLFNLDKPSVWSLSKLTLDSLD